MVKYRVFSFRATKTVEEKSTGLLGGVSVNRREVRLYVNTHDLYDAVAAFVTELGYRLITISGTPWGEYDNSYMRGDVVVWYHE